MFHKLLPQDPAARALGEALRACRRHFLIAGVFSALVNLLYLTPTLYMMQVYNRVVPTGGITTLVVLSVIVLFALATLAALDTLRSRLLFRAGLRLDRLLSGRVLRRVIGAGAGGHGGEALRNLDAVRTGLTGQGATAVFDLPWTLIYLLVCFLLHPLLGMLTLVSSVTLFVLALLNERTVRPKLQTAIKAAAGAYQAQETIGSRGEVVRALGMQEVMIGRQLRERETATQAQAEAQLAGGGYGGAIRFTRLAMQSLALGLGAYLAVRGEISSGAIIAASVLLSRTVAPIEQIVGAWPQLVSGRTAWISLVDLFKKTVETEVERTALPVPTGRVTTENVSVRFNDKDDPQLKNINLALEPGQVTGVIGPSGSGKTTLARVLAGGVPPGLGVVRMDGADYRAWDSDALAAHIGYLPQRPTLFAGTVKENISRYAGDGDPADRLSDAEIDASAVAAAQRAGVHDLILRLPQGYDTVLGPEGAGLSAGQGQRVALARALFGEPKLLVLDEPNSNLDQEGEAALLSAIRQAATGGAAVLLVAHRAGVLNIADRLAVMRGGAIEIQGPRDEVMARLQPQTGPRIASVQ